MLSHDDRECLAGLVREYIQNPYETERRYIIRDFLEDRGDYRYERVSHFDRVHERIMNIGAEMLEIPLHTSVRLARSVDNHPILGDTKVPLRRAYLCSLFRYMPIFRVLESTGLRETVQMVDVSNTVETAWDWMRSVGNHVTWLIYRNVVVGEMVFSHLIEFRERMAIYNSTEWPGIGPELKYHHLQRLYRDDRTYAANLNQRRWDTLTKLAVACDSKNYSEQAREISLDTTLSSPHDMLARNFNYNLWSRIYSVFPAPRTK